MSSRLFVAALLTITSLVVSPVQAAPVSESARNITPETTLIIAHALLRCGDLDGLARKGLESFLSSSGQKKDYWSRSDLYSTVAWKLLNSPAEQR